MSMPSRLARVSSRFALMTQCTLVRRYHGACAAKNFHAPLVVLKVFR